MTDAFDRIRALQGVVRECLAAIDAASPEDPDVGRAFRTLETGFAELGDPALLLRQAQGEERERLREELSNLARVHAVLVLAVTRDRDRLCALLERAQLSSAAMKAASAGECSSQAWSA